MSDSTGLTKDAGWEMGARQTIAAPLHAIWSYLVGEGLAVWLGDIDSLPNDRGAAYETRDGVRGTIRSYTENHRVRLSWWPEDWPHDTILQVTVKDAVSGTTVGFHHERLADREERKLMLGHWKNVLGAISEHFS